MLLQSQVAEATKKQEEAERQLQEAKTILLRLRKQNEEFVQENVKLKARLRGCERALLEKNDQISVLKSLGAEEFVLTGLYD